MDNVKVRPLVKAKEIKYHIPTYDEIVKEGVEIVSKSVGEELIWLLQSSERKYLSLEDLDKIRNLIKLECFKKNKSELEINRLINERYYEIKRY